MKTMGKKKKKKYTKWIGDPDYDSSRINFVDARIHPWQKPQGFLGDNIPPPMTLSMQDGHGLFLGLPSEMETEYYIGVPLGTEGNFVVIGGNGSGKSSGIAKPSLKTWGGAICATDIKGELSEDYKKLYQNKLVKRQCIIFDPTDAKGPSYDPYWLLAKDNPENLYNNIWEIVLAIIPSIPNEKEPFWVQSEQSVLAAALLYYFKLGLSFSETIAVIMNQSVSTLCTELSKNGCFQVRSLLASLVPSGVNNIMVGIDRGLRNKLTLFANDSYISHAFRGEREGANCFTWEDLDTHNIFLRIPADRVEQWSGAINLMYTQLIRTLERRPEKHSREGANNVQTLLLMDEFARFGKLERITAAMATLRSKNVNICLMIQSVAQLDRIYDEYERRIMFDNCQFQAILRANDADTQKYLCELIGTRVSIQRSASELMNEDRDITGYGKQVSEVRDWAVQPHEMSTLNDVLLLTPYGFCRVERFRPYNKEMQSVLGTKRPVIHLETVPDPIPKDRKFCSTPAIRILGVCLQTDACDVSKMNEGATIMSIEERCKNADRHIEIAERQQRIRQNSDREKQKRRDRHRLFIIGELVVKYFPTVQEYELGATDNENRAQLERLEAFLYVLSTNTDLIEALEDQATQLVLEDPDGEWRMSN